MDGASQALQGRTCGRPLIKRFQSPSRLFCTRRNGCVASGRDLHHVDEHAGGVFEVFLPAFVEAGYGAAVDNAMVA